MEEPLILNRYRLLETRGKGGSGTVEVAFDTRMQRRVAIKRIPFSSEASRTAPGLSEARTAAMLSHTNIVQVYDFEMTDTEGLIIMEYVDGPTLTQLVAMEDGELDLDEIASIVSDVGQALDFAHDNHVLHLDIKPDNILIDKTGNAKVADFGVAAIADVFGVGTATGGTIGYMPPEQIRGEQLDSRTDEWAFASMVYQLLTGTNPFKASSLSRALAYADSAEVTEPSISNTELDEEIDGVVLDALSPDRDVRFDDVHDFTEALLPWLGDAARGHAVIRRIVCDEGEEEEEAAEEERHLDWEKIRPKLIGGACRVLSAAVCFWFLWIGAQTTPLTQTLAVVLPACVAFACLLAPQMGVGVMLVGLIVELYVGQAPLLASALAIVSLIWWFSQGRRSEVDAALPLLAPLSTVALIPALYPLVDGFCLKVDRAFETVLFSGCLMFAACSICGSTNLLICPFRPMTIFGIDTTFIALITSPTVWIGFAGWVLAGVFMSTLCARGSKVLSIVGSASGCIFMIAGLMIAGYITAGVWALPAGKICLAVGLSFIVMCVVGLLFPSYGIVKTHG